MFLFLRRRLEVCSPHSSDWSVVVDIDMLTCLVALYCVDANPIAIFVVNFIAIM